MHRWSARLTQSELGRRAGIVGKYVSEIERGTRDVPFSTLRAIVEDGLGLILDVRFYDGSGEPPSETIPRSVVDVAHGIAGLEPNRRATVMAIIRILLKLAGQ